MDVRPGDVWRCGRHTVYVASVLDPRAWDHVFKEEYCEAQALFLEGAHAGAWRRVDMAHGMWTLLLRCGEAP